MNCRRTLSYSLLLWIIAAGHQAQSSNHFGRSEDHKPGENNRIESDITLLDELGTYPGAVLIREYVQGEIVSRQYATDIPLEKSPAAVTEFYHHKLIAKGWRNFNNHAAISCYEKGERAVYIMRSGPEDPGLPPGALMRKSALPPAGAKFFFSIEAGPRLK